MDENITSNALKFADDPILFRKLNNNGDKQHLQNVLNFIRNGRCCSSLGNVNAYIQDPGNLEVNYKMEDAILGTTIKENDSFIILHASLDTLS